MKQLFEEVRVLNNPRFDVKTGSINDLCSASMRYLCGPEWIRSSVAHRALNI